MEGGKPPLRIGVFWVVPPAVGLRSSAVADSFGLSQNFEITHTPVGATMGRPRFYLGSYSDLGRAMRAPTMNFADGFGLFARVQTNT